MRIDGLDLFSYDLALSRPVELGGATLRRREGVLIRLTADDGSEGWGESAPLPGFSAEGPSEAAEQLRGREPFLVGRRLPAAPSVLRHVPPSVLSGLSPSARFGLELAVLNLAASSGGGILPGLLTDRPSGVVSTNGLLSGTPEEVLSGAASMREAGYGAVKLKVGRGGIDQDIEIVLGVAGALGDGVSLRLDANRAWGYEEALAFAGGVTGARIQYVEEPLADPGGLAGLAGEWGLPVALDESLVGMTPGGLKEHRYAKAVVLKPTLIGGMSRALRLAGEAEALGMAAVVSSSYEAGVGTGALVALAATAGGEPAGLDTYRALAGDVIHPRLPLPAPAVDVREAVEAARSVDVGRLEPVLAGR